MVCPLPATSANHRIDTINWIDNNDRTRPFSRLLAAFCRQHAYRGGKTAAELLARLHAAPPHLTDSTRSCWLGSSWPRSRCYARS